MKLKEVEHIGHWKEIELHIKGRLRNIDLENICVSVEELSTQAEMIPHENDDVMIVEEQQAFMPRNASKASDQCPAVIEILDKAGASGITETVDEDFVLIKESKID